MGRIVSDGNGANQNNAQKENNVEGTSLEKELKRSKAKSRLDIIFLAILIIGVLLYREISADKESATEIGRDSIKITAADGVKHVISFDEVETAELFDDFSAFNMGELVSGGETRKAISAIYRNAELGEYALFVTPKYQKYIVVEVPEETIVFNYRSKEDTEALYNLIRELMEESQQ